MEFEINDTKWTIEIVNEDRMNNEMKNDNTLGVTIYNEQKVLLLESQANIIKTLKHELVHVWLYEYGHNQSEKEFNCEDVCEIVAKSKINKLLTAIRMNNVDIKIDTVELYSETTEKYFKVYKVYIKEWDINKNGEYVHKYMLQDEYVSKIELLKYLINKYRSLKEGEADG